MNRTHTYSHSFFSSNRLGLGEEYRVLDNYKFYQICLNTTSNRSITTHYTSTSYSARYTFSGKERDEETGYSYFGARYYNSSYSIWMSVDPMANKYPSLSPYVYCGNNPVKLVDPSGEEIWIIGVDGSNIHYSQGMNYSGKDESVLNKINSLNQMNSTKNGEKLLGKLTTSKNVYAIVDKSCDNIKEAYYCANDLSNGKAGGTIVTQGDNSLKTLSHELFHAFQDEKGQGRASIHNEVEAMLFETSVLADYAYNNSEGYPSSALLGDNDYYNSIVSGLLNDFSTAGMNNVIRDFKSQSRANIGGTYNNYPLRQRNQSNNLIQDFYPLLPWKK